MIQCEVTKDVPADDELVAMLTVSEAFAGVSPSPSVVTEADASSAGPAAIPAELPSLSPSAMPRSPVSRSDDEGGSRTVFEGKTGEPSTMPVISAENSDCRACPAPASAHHTVISNSRKKDRTTNHPHLTTSASSLSDMEQQRRSFCKYCLVAVLLTVVAVCIANQIVGSS